jgi:beta-glucosidase
MDNTESGARKAQFVDGTWNRWYTDPSMRGEYPEDIMSFRKNIGTAPEISKGDMDIIKNNICDFLGINYYFRFRVYDNGPDKPFRWYECVNSKPVPNSRITDMGWEVYPSGLYEIMKNVESQYGKVPLYITENGMASVDGKIIDGRVEDDDRLDYLRSHLEMCRKALDEGVNIKGYYYWSLMDNFEWASGYAKKFGLVRIDYKTQKRTVKKSGIWYADFIKGQGD